MSYFSILTRGMFHSLKSGLLLFGCRYSGMISNDKKLHTEYYVPTYVLVRTM